LHRSGKTLDRDYPTAFQFQESGTFYRDLSKNPGVDNLVMPDVHFEITTGNMEEEMENLVERAPKSSRYAWFIASRVPSI
jgi:hypothetical protein